MKIVDMVKEWFHPRQPGPACYACGVTELEDPRVCLQHFEDVLACHTCLSQPMAFYALKRKYWYEHPEKVPPCLNCGEVVPPGQLHLVGRRDWPFCTSCAMDSDVLLHWGRLRRKLGERRARELGARKS
jgi:hypothetical protein